MPKVSEIHAIGPGHERVSGVLMTMQLFKFSDRREARYMLSPTHEEEITTLIARTTFSYKELPIRLFQISTLTAR